MTESEMERTGQEMGLESAPQPRIQTPQTEPLVTYTLLALSILVFVLQVGTNLLLGQDLPAAYGVKNNRWIEAGQYWRLLTPMLLHGSIIHLGFNMYALYILGRRLERFFGHTRFLALYIISGFCGNIFSFMLTQASSLGSSTAIFGLLGAEGVFIYQHRDLLGERFEGALRQIIQVALINLLIGLSPGIDNWGHIGGLLGGVAFTWFAGPLFQLEGIFPLVELKDKRSRDVANVVFLIMAFLLLALVWLILTFR
ncbi:MAG: rhomboid family intramembrane serine protease [Anaerolineales bacterium]